MLFLKADRQRIYPHAGQRRDFQHKLSAALIDRCSPSSKTCFLPIWCQKISVSYCSHQRNTEEGARAPQNTYLLLEVLKRGVKLFLFTGYGYTHI